MSNARKWAIFGLLIGLLCVGYLLWPDLHLAKNALMVRAATQKSEVVLPEVAPSFLQTLRWWPKARFTHLVLRLTGFSAELRFVDDVFGHLQNIGWARLQTLANSVSSDSFRYLVVFQNDQELRATGGFLGSFATVELNQGRLAPITVTDIYAPAGQLTDFVSPPPGLREYLSSGKGWGLPDANWSPDFPTSAMQILKFLAAAKYPEYRGVVAVNTQAVAAVLDYTGPIYLPDQKQTVSAENFTDILRADRGSFFAGSYQKVNTLKQLGTHLQTQIANLSPRQKIGLVMVLYQQAKDRNILFFSQHPDQQAAFEEFGAAGLFPAIHSADELFVGSVESNVGINKVNPFVQRRIELDLRHNPEVQLTITFYNSHPNQNYINYQRLYIPADTELTTLSQDNQPLSATTSAQFHLQEVGFLAPVPAQKFSTISATLRRKGPQPPPWQIVVGWQQPGLHKVKWQVELPSSSQPYRSQDGVSLKLMK